MRRLSSIPCFVIALLIIAIALLPAALSAEDRQAQEEVSLSAKSGNSTLTQGARCTVREDASGWWLVSPSGKPFFSLGICEFNQGTDRQSYDSARPSYAGWKHYDSETAWASKNLRRLKSWGFTTLGGWSDLKTAEVVADQDLWITPVLSLGARSGSPWFEMWDEKVVGQIDKVAKETITPLRDNPRVIGYYSDNELGWWNAILWRMTLEQPATSGQRQRLVQTVRDSYHDNWNAMLKDLEPQNASSWEDLSRSGMLWLRPGGNGIQTMRRFLGVIAERYYQLMHDAILKYDPKGMYLGDRYQSFYYPAVALGARKHVDIVSANLNATWNDGTFPFFFLDTLYKLTRKPLIVSEFYMAAAENSSGNPNKSSGFPTVDTQRERSVASKNTLAALTRCPYVVGADWFQYYDEPPHGRKKDGEDYNFGLIDIHDRPYGEITEAFATSNPTSLKSAGPSRLRDATAGVPPAPVDPLAQFRPLKAIKSWDRTRGFVSPTSSDPLGDLYICWSPKAIYLATIVLDIAEPDYYKDGHIPEMDRAKWTIHFDGRKPIVARVGSGQDPVVSNRIIRVASLSGTYHDVRCLTAVELQADQLGRKQFAPGDRIKFQSSFETLGRASSIKWQGEFVLAE